MGLGWIYSGKEGRIMKHKSIMDAIKNSELGKYQRIIDRCNDKKGCNTHCSKLAQADCSKLKQHADEVTKLDYEGK